jgi:hypothetical protein
MFGFFPFTPCTSVGASLGTEASLLFLFKAYGDILGTSGKKASKIWLSFSFLPCFARQHRTKNRKANLTIL